MQLWVIQINVEEIINKIGLPINIRFNVSLKHDELILCSRHIKQYNQIEIKFNTYQHRVLNIFCLL